MRLFPIDGRRAAHKNRTAFSLQPLLSNYGQFAELASTLSSEAFRHSSKVSSP